MPYIDVETRNDWVKFTNAIENVSQCCPARSTILTGQYSHHTGVEDNTDGARLNEKHTIATWLHNAPTPYRTGFFGKYLNAYPFGRPFYVPPGWDEWVTYWGHCGNNGDAVYYDYYLRDRNGLTCYGHAPADYSTDVLAGKARDFILDPKTAEPFFVYFAPNGPHSPWIPSPSHKTDFSDVVMPRAPNFNEDDLSDKPQWLQAIQKKDPADVDKQRRQEWRTLRSVDDATRTIVDTLRAKGAGVLDRTTIFYVSDNGHAYGEHRLNRKGCLYEECNKLVWYVRDPPTPGRTEARVVTNADLAPTIAALAGATPDIPQDGLNLVPLIEDPETTWPRDAVLTRWAGGPGGGCPPYWGIRTHTEGAGGAQEFAYMELVDDQHEKELYDLLGTRGTPDPYELTNVANKAGYADIQNKLALKLAKLRGPPPKDDRFCAPPPPPPGSYDHATGTGQPIIPGTVDIGNHCDDCTTQITFPFPVEVYGQTYMTGNVSSNGNIQFGSNIAQYANVCLPTYTFDRAISPYWDDLLTDGVGEGVYTATVGNQFVVEWRAHYFDHGGTANFEAIFTQGSGDIGTRYGTDFDRGASATIGLQADPTRAHQFSCNAASLNNPDFQVAYTPPGPPPPPPPPPPPSPGKYRIVLVHPSPSFVAGETDIQNHCDDCTTNVNFPFPVRIYNSSYTSAKVDSNGDIQLAPINTDYENLCLPVGFTLNRMIFPYWDDLRTEPTAMYPDNGIYTKTTGSPPNQSFVIEWRAVYYDDTARRANFEVVFNQSGSTHFEMRYSVVEQNGGSATVGAQAEGTTNLVTDWPFTQFSCNRSAITQGLALKYVYIP